MKAEDIRRQRHRLGLSQKELAQRLGVSQPAVSNWEAGRTRPRETDAVGLAAVLSGFVVEDPPAGPPSNYGTWVADRRSALGLARADLARQAGISQMQVYNIELGRTLNPREQTRRAIEAVLQGAPPRAITTAVREEVEVVGLGQLTDFNPHDKADIPEEPGVYVLYDISERPVYVGQAGNIRERIANPHTGHIDKFWYRSPIVETAAYLRVPDERLRRQLEQTLIKFLRRNAVINKKGVERE